MNATVGLCLLEIALVQCGLAFISLPTNVDCKYTEQMNSHETYVASIISLSLRALNSR